jgi:hypothetical protein
MLPMHTEDAERIERIRRMDPEIAAGLERATALLASARRHGEEAERLRQEHERLNRLYGRRFILIRF